MEVCVHRRPFFVAEDFLYNNKMKNFLKKNTSLVIGLFVVLLAFFMISSNVEKFISFSDFLMKPANINDIRSDCIVNSLPMGYSGENGRIRLYTASECNKLNGILYPNGECLRPGGGSFSWDCRGLNHITRLAEIIAAKK